MNKNNSTKLLSIGSGEYWKAALSELKNIRTLIVCALLCAIAIVIEYFNIKIIPNILEIQFGFIIVSLCSFLSGPVMAIPCGIIVDVVAFLIANTGYGFFPGYTLTAVLSALIYALILYRAPLSLSKLFFARFMVNILINVFLGSVWRLMYNWPYGLSVIVAGVKNLLLLPIEVYIMAIFFSALLPSLKKLKLCAPSQEIKIKKWQVIIFTLVVLVLIAAVVLAYIYAPSIKDFIYSFK